MRFLWTKRRENSAPAPSGQESRSATPYELGMTGIPVGLLYGDSAGVTVTPETAMRLSAFWACVSIISKTISTLPRHLVRRDRIDGPWLGEATDHPLYEGFHWDICPFETGDDYWEWVVANVLVYGNAFSVIERNARGQVRLLPWPSECVRVRPAESDYWRNEYLFMVANGKDVVLSDVDVFHVKGIRVKGRAGLSPVSVLRETLGEGLAAIRHNAKYLEQGGRPSGIISIPGLGAEAVKDVEERWNNAHRGVENAGKHMFTGGEARYQSLSIPHKDAQFLELRGYNGEDICRIFGLPPHMAGFMGGATFSNIEQQFLEYKQGCALPLVRKLESSSDRKLLPGRDRWFYAHKFNMDGLARGDLLARAEAAKTLVLSAQLTPNEGRKLEGRPPVNGGDTLLVPLNMIAIDQATAAPALAKDGGDKPSEDAPARSAQSEFAFRENPLLSQAREVRADAAMKNLLRVRKAFSGNLRAAWQRVVDAEINELKKRAAKRSVLDTNDLRPWYADRLPDLLKRNVAPVLESYSEFVAEIAAGEIGAGEDFDSTGYREGYMSALRDDYENASLGQLASIETGEPLDTRLDEWREGRAGKLSAIDAVGFAAGLSVALWAANGVTRKVWRISGATTCPLCTKMNGRTASISGAFLNQWDRLDAENVSTLVCTRDILTAPLHSGCDCHVGPA